MSFNGVSIFRTTRISPTIQNIARILTGNDTLPEFLKNDFVRLLNSIDKKMLHSDDLKLQKQSLQRIRKLVEMMGPYLSTHAPKIMVLLIFATDKEALQMDGLDVLHFLLKQLAEASRGRARAFGRWIYYWIRKLTSCTTGSRLCIYSACP